MDKTAATATYCGLLLVSECLEAYLLTNNGLSN